MGDGIWRDRLAARALHEVTAAPTGRLRILIPLRQRFRANAMPMASVEGVVIPVKSVPIAAGVCATEGRMPVSTTLAPIAVRPWRR